MPAFVEHGDPMNLLAWSLTHHQHVRTQPHPILATAERLLGGLLPLTDDELGSRLADALAALLAALEGPPALPAVPR